MTSTHAPVRYLIWNREFQAAYATAPVETAIEATGGKRKGVISYHLESTKRFNDCTPKITQRMLTKQFRELENDGIIQLTVYAEAPSRVKNDLTDLHRTLQRTRKVGKQYHPKLAAHRA